ncbi:hypothetical protein G9A89_016833 [Geosiphon pyriformis]|nr:hypothetical protein G9A89_016833 [Geosiphon pyriformis]
MFSKFNFAIFCRFSNGSSRSLHFDINICSSWPYSPKRNHNEIQLAACHYSSLRRPHRVRQLIRKPWRSQIDIFSFPHSGKILAENGKTSSENFEKVEASTGMLYDTVPIREPEGLNAFQRLMFTVKRQAISTFMPKGYPDSVTKDYWDFTKWQILNKVAGSVTGVLSMQSLLFAMGLGAKSVPLAAAFNWIIKDGLGQFGGVLYAAFISSRFDSEPKRYRFQASLSMQLACLVELITPLYPHLFILLASISNIGKNICWLAGAASRAQMTKTFALRDNLGDITGKSRSQGTAAGLLGTGIGIAISATITAISTPISIISAAQPVTYISLAFAPFSVLNVYASYRSNLYVTSSTLNIQRTELILDYLLRKRYLETGLDGLISNSKGTSISQLVPSPREISRSETFVKRYHSLFQIPLVMEPTLHYYVSKEYLEDLRSGLLQEGFLHPEQYFILYIPEHHLFEKIQSSQPSFSKLLKEIENPGHKRHVALLFSNKATTKDIIKGFLHACIIRYILEHDKSIPYDDRKKVIEAIQKTHQNVNHSFDNLLEGLVAKGWDIEHLYLTEKDDERRLIIEE